MVQYKLFIVILVTSMLFTNKNTDAQKLTQNQQIALNNYIEYLNFGAKELTDETECLYDYYSTVESYRKHKKNSYGLQTKSICAGKDDGYYYDKAINESNKLNLNDAEQLNDLLNKTHEVYNSIIKNLRELEIYNRLKDYETDEFKRHDELLPEIQKLFQNYISSHQNLYKETYAVYRKYQTYNKSNLYHFHENELKTYLDTEQGFFKIWNLNFEKHKFTENFPLDEIIQSINETDRKHYPFGTDTKLKYPTNRYYSSFWGSVHSMQASKRNAIDDNTIKAVNDDMHSNESYKDFYQIFNNSLVNYYNNYVWSCGQKGIYLLKYPKSVPSFVINKQHKIHKADIEYEIPPQELYFPKLITQTKPFSKEVAVALNNFVEYINKEIRIASDRPRFMESYNKSINRYKNYSRKKLEKYQPSSLRIHNDYRLALSDYEKAINDSRFLPEEYSQILNKQTEAIKLICNRRRQLSEKINKYADNETYLNDNFKDAYNFINEFDKLWNEFDKRTEILYSVIKKIYNSYPEAYPEHSWQKSGDILFNILLQDKKLLKDAKRHYKDSLNMSLKTDTLSVLCRHTLLNEYENLQGLKKLGRYHGHCPYTPYEDIPDESKDFSIKYLKQKELEKDTVIHGEYNEFVRLYNNIADDYNKFVWLAEGNYETARAKEYQNICLLYAKKENDIFKIISSDPPKKETVIIKDDTDIFITMEGYAENNLILLLDVSQSMNKPEKLPLLKNSFKKLLKILRTEDKVAIVIYSGDAQIAMESTSCSEKDKITDIIDNLDSGGSTNIEKGMKTAFKLANNNFIENGNNRIILATDGEFTVDPKLSKLVKKYSDNNIHLSVFHFGKNKGKKISLYELSQIGNGNYEIITEENSDEKLVKEAKAVRVNE